MRTGSRLAPQQLIPTERKTGWAERAAQPERTFVAQTYFSPILLNSTLRRMGEKYVHVGKVRPRSGRASGGHLCARGPVSGGASKGRHHRRTRVPGSRRLDPLAAATAPEITRPGEPGERTAHGRTGPLRGDSHFSLRFRDCSLIARTRCRAPMCADPLCAHGSVSPTATDAVVPHDSGVLLSSDCR